MKFPVTRDRNNESEWLMLDANDILYINVEDRTVVFHTQDEKFYLLDTLSALSKHMEPLGFRKLDRINLVNINKIKYFDDEHSKVFFEKNITRTSKYATVSFMNKNSLKKQIEEWIRKNSISDTTT